MSETRDKRLNRAQMRVLFRVPFFAAGVAKLPVTWATDEECKRVFGDDPKNWTAYTDGQLIKWCTGFFDRCTDDQLVTVLCHEAAHCMLGHLWRVPSTVQGADGWQLWNEATDHAVNLMLKEFSAQVTAKQLADPFPFPDPQDAYCADPQYSGLAEEVIFSRLNQRPKGKPGGKPGQGKPGQGGKGSMPSFGQIVQPGNGAGNGAAPDPAAQKQLQASWDSTLINAAKMAKGRGDLPAGMDRYVQDLLEPKIPWWEILRSWLREQCSDDWDFMKPALEWDESGFILPSLRSDKVGEVVFATDTSGSINREVLAQFQTEKQNCLDDMRPRKLVDIYCDSKVHRVEEYGPGDEIVRHAPGGGGTDFRPVFAHLEKKQITPKAVVYLTDLDGSFPATPPPYPVLWVTWVKDGKAPFGEVIYAEAD